MSIARDAPLTSLRGRKLVPEDNTRCHPDADDIAPALGEIEQVRIEQRADDILSYQYESNPSRKSFATKYNKMRDPHRE